MANDSNYYSILGIGNNASAEEIKSAYRKLARELHPDKETGDTAKMQDLNEAYRILGNEERRKVYDLQFRQAKPEGNKATNTEQRGRQSSSPENRARAREYVDDPFADLFGGVDGMNSFFDEYSRQIHVDLNNLFGGIGGFGFGMQEELKDEFVMPENDWGLLNALRQAYQAKNDGEWSVSRTENDRRSYMPGDIYQVRRQNGQVAILRTIKDLRHEYRREEPIVIENGGSQTQYDANILIGEGFFKNGGRKLVNDSVNIPSTFYDYLRALHSLAKKLATSEGKIAVDTELRVINHYSERSAFRYAEEGARKPGKELIERVSFSEFHRRLNSASKLVNEIKPMGKEGQSHQPGNENTRK